MSEVKGKKDFDGSIDGAGYKKSMDDPNKPPLTMVPPTLDRGIAQVLGFGAAKYARGNWMRGMSFSEVMDAMKRHIAAWELGEELDPDSGLPHLYHAGCELAFLSWFQHGPRASEYGAFDDRLFKAPEPLDIAEITTPVGDCLCGKLPRGHRHLNCVATPSPYDLAGMARSRARLTEVRASL